MSALLRYQAAIFLRSYRWIFPVILYGLLLSVGFSGGTPLAQGLDWIGAILVPVVALITRSMLTAEPPAARACVAAAAGPKRAQFATLLVAAGAGVALLSTVAVVILAVASDVSPAGAALRGGGPAAQAPGWPVLPLLSATVLLVVTWTASMLVAARRTG